MVGLGAAPAFVQLAILLFLPETPRWLVQAGQVSAARRVLCKVYRVSSGSERVADRVLRAIEKEVAEEDESSGSKTEAKWCYHTFQTLSELCRVGGNRRALIIAMMLQGLQQLCGFNSLMYFSATIFQSLSFSSPTLTSLSVALTNFLFTFVAFSLIDRIGRRRILLYSIPAMVVSLFVCSFAFANLKMPSTTHQRRQGETPGNSFMPVLILLSLTLYTASFASGLGNVPWQQSELFPLRVRSLGSALATATNWGSNFIVGLTFLPMMEILSPSWTFVVYALICMTGWFGVWTIYPEMSGLGLEEVKGLLANGWGVDEPTRKIPSDSPRQIRS